MTILRTYRCNDCGGIFQRTLTDDQSAAPPPDCPFCTAAAEGGQAAENYNCGRQIERTYRCNDCGGMFKVILTADQWPASPPPDCPFCTAAAEGGQVAENDNAGPIPKANCGGRPSAESEIHKALNRLSQRHHVKTMARMRLAKLVASACTKQIGDKGWSRSIVLKHIRSGLKRLPVPAEPEPKEQ